MSQQDKGKQSNKNLRVKMFNKLSKDRTIKWLKINKNQAHNNQATSAIGASSLSSLLDGWWCLRHSKMSN
jgi:hypothetical protein